MPPVSPRKRKKFSIFTSATTPYGPSRNARIAGTDIEPTAYRNSPSRTYLRLRNAISARRGRRNVRPKVCRPSRHRYSEIAPTGHSQPQKLLRNIQDAARNAIRSSMPAACMAGIRPVSSRAFRFISDAIGSQPSTPSGRAASIDRPPVS